MSDRSQAALWRLACIVVQELVDKGWDEKMIDEKIDSLFGQKIDEHTEWIVWHRMHHIFHQNQANPSQKIYGESP